MKNMKEMSVERLVFLSFLQSNNLL